jgi:hypothetical protein
MVDEVLTPHQFPRLDELVADAKERDDRDGAFGLRLLPEASGKAKGEQFERKPVLLSFDLLSRPTHCVTASRQLQLDQLPVRFTGSR